MPRKAREKSESGIYHIMLRGINKQMLFQDGEDYQKFLKVIKECKDISDYKLMAYCLMGNHLHMLLKEESEPPEQIIKRIGVRYAYWYNSKYARSGHLFQDRFKSEPVEDDQYFLTVLRYIHQNPVKAGLCKDVSEYKWSSYHDYINGYGITDTRFALSMLKDDKKEAIVLFENFMKQNEEANCLDNVDKYRYTDNEAQAMLINICGTDSAVEFQKLSQEEKSKTIALLKQNGFSIRQITRLTGFSFGIVRKC